MMATPGPTAQEQELMTHIFSFREDPEGFVMFCYPWGKEGTPLEEFDGPEDWQLDLLKRLAEHMLKNRRLRSLDLDAEVFKHSTKAGHGVGKSAVISWLIEWFESTRPGAVCNVTANTENQLRSKTWPELSKWVNLSIISHWWDVTATKMKPHKWLADLVREQLKIDDKYWYAEALTWNEDKPESFAGTHSQYGTAVVYDESSTIPRPIWETSEGALTDSKGDKIWLVFGNPTQRDSEFFSCFHLNRRFWTTQTVDSRTVRITNKKHLNQIIEKYGPDSDQARVRVYGEFPHADVDQFISESLVIAAQERSIAPDPGAPLVMGVDCARGGEDQTVIRFRKGRDARSIPAVKMSTDDTMKIVGKVGELIRKHDPDRVFVDMGGIGAGVYDRLRELRYPVTGVDFGAKSSDKTRFFNRRSEMWWNMREGLETIGIDDDPELRADLTGPLYSYVQDTSKLRLETKKEMKKRKLPSPDDGDALALTFAAPVARRDLRMTKRFSRNRVAQNVDYGIFG